MKLPSALVPLFIAGSLCAAPDPITSSAAPYPKDAKTTIERLDPAFDALVATDAVVEHLGSGFNWSEGPVWDPAQGALLFSDVPENRVYRWKDGAGITVFLEPSGFTGSVYNGRERGSNGLTLDPQGRLTLCQHGDRRVARLAADGKHFETIVDKIEGKRFSSPNDLCFDRGGNLKVVTNRLKPGYYWKNGMPYTANVAMTEYFRTMDLPDRSQWIRYTQIVDDPEYLTQPWIVNYAFKKLPDGSKWNPTPCSVK